MVCLIFCDKAGIEVHEDSVITLVYICVIITLLNKDRLTGLVSDL